MLRSFPFLLPSPLVHFTASIFFSYSSLCFFTLTSSHTIPTITFQCSSISLQPSTHMTFQSSPHFPHHSNPLHCPNITAKGFTASPNTTLFSSLGAASQHPSPHLYRHHNKHSISTIAPFTQHFHYHSYSDTTLPQLSLTALASPQHPSHCPSSPLTSCCFTTAASSHHLQFSAYHSAAGRQTGTSPLNFYHT